MDIATERVRLVKYKTRRVQYISRLPQVLAEHERLKDMIDNYNYKILLQQKLIKKLEADNER